MITAYSLTLLTVREIMVFHLFTFSYISLKLDKVIKNNKSVMFSFANNNIYIHIES